MTELRSPVAHPYIPVHSFFFFLRAMTSILLPLRGDRWSVMAYSGKENKNCKELTEGYVSRQAFIWMVTSWLAFGNLAAVPFHPFFCYFLDPGSTCCGHYVVTFRSILDQEIIKEWRSRINFWFLSGHRKFLYSLIFVRDGRRIRNWLLRSSLTVVTAHIFFHLMIITGQVSRKKRLKRIIPGQYIII